MPDSYAGLVKGVTTTSGTGTYTVSSPSATLPYRSIAQAITKGSLADGDIVRYVARDTTVLGNASFEAGEGTLTVAPGPVYQISRDTIYDGSNGPGTPVSWGGSGQRDFYIDTVHGSVIARTDRANTFTQNQSIVGTLDVSGAVTLNSSGASNDVQIKGLTDDNLSYWDASADRLGIGTPTPLRKLHVQATSPALARISTPTVNGLAGLEVLNDALSWQARVASDDAFEISDATNSKIPFTIEPSALDNSIYIDSSGQVGIGTAAPGANLDVRGGAVFNENGAAVDFRIEGDTDANLFVADGSADAIGIGTATPTKKLEVTGDITARDTSVSSEPGIEIENDEETWRFTAIDADLRLIRDPDVSAATVLNMTSNSNLGIGTVSDVERLTVNGVVAVADITSFTPGTTTGWAKLWVSDGFLKVKFSNGTVKTIADDT